MWVDQREHAFQFMYLVLRNGADKAAAALEMGDPERARGYLAEGAEQAQYIYRTSSRKNDILLDENGSLLRYFEYNCQTGQTMNLRDTPLPKSED